MRSSLSLIIIATTSKVHQKGLQFADFFVYQADFNNYSVLVVSDFSEFSAVSSSTNSGSSSSTTSSLLLTLSIIFLVTTTATPTAVQIAVPIPITLKTFS